MKFFLVLSLLLPALAWAQQSQWQAASAAAAAGAAAISGGNTQSVNVSGDSVKQAPNVYAPAILPTSPCMGSSSGGGSGSGFGLSFGTSWTDDECNTRETARLFSGMGLSSDAIAVLCSSKFAQVAPSCAAFRPAECHADEIVAKRLGIGVCK